MRVLVAFHSWLRKLIAVGLIASGGVVLWQSQELMVWLIHRVGEERALGERNVYRTPEGGVMLTNPGALVAWALPFWGLAALLMAGGVLLLCPCGWCATRGFHRADPPPTR